MRRRGWTLVGTMATLVIIVLLMGATMYGSGMLKGQAPNSRKDGLGKTIPGQARYRAKDEVCRSNIGQVRQALQILSINEEDRPPESLSEVKVPAEMKACAVGFEPYMYDPSTGAVACVHPGHEKY